MNKVEIEPISRNVKTQSVKRSVEIQLFHVMSGWYFLRPTFLIDVPKEREK